MNTTQTVDTTIPITIRVYGGNLAVHGSEQMNEAQIISALGSRQEDGAYHVGGHAVLRVPARSALNLEGIISEGAISNVREVMLESVAGNLAVNRVGRLAVADDLHGNTVLRHINEALTLNAVHGNVAARRLHSMHADSIYGNLAVSEVSDAIQIDHVMGNVALDKIGPSAHFDQIDGRLALNGPLADDGNYQFIVKGKVRLRVSGNVHFVLHTPGAVRFGEGIEGGQNEDGEWELFLGARENAARVEIESDRDVEINFPVAHSWNAFSMGPEFEESMAEMRRAIDEVKETVRNNFAGEEGAFLFGQSGDWQRMGENIGQSVQAIVNDFIDSLRPQPVSRRRTEPSSAPSGDELQTVLKMVEQGEISAEEAEKLIDAMS